MGLFNEIGRKVEAFKQSATASTESDAEYLCAACDQRLKSDYEECPACGEAAVHSTSFDE